MRPDLVRTIPGSMNPPSFPPGSLAMVERYVHVWPLSVDLSITADRFPVSPSGA